jgi:hypothetical protein
MNENVIRTITIKGTSEGLDKVTADVNKLADAQQNVAVVSDQSAKRVLSLEDAWKKQTLRLDETARSQANLSREMKTADAALREGIATQEQHAIRIDQINQKYGQATVAQKAFSAATSGVSSQLIALSAGAGPVGTFLAGLGPWGLAAAAGLGAVEAVFNRLSEGAARFGDKAIELKKFADVTGLSATEIKALSKAGVEFGVSSDDVRASIERLSVGLAEAHKSTGDLYTKIREISPALATELASTRTTAQGWDVLAQALKRATDAAQRNALARAAFGRGGIETGIVAATTVDKGGVAAMGAEMTKLTGITDQQIARVAQLRIANEELKKSNQAAWDAAFALPVLERENQYLQGLKAINDELLKGNIIKSTAQTISQPSVGNFAAGGAQEFNDAIEAARLEATNLDAIVQSTVGKLSEGAMQAREEATALREAADVEAQFNDDLTSIINKEKERLGILGSAATYQDRITLKTLELGDALEKNIINEQEFNRALGAAVDAEDARAKSQEQTYRSAADTVPVYQDTADAADRTAAANRRAADYAGAMADQMRAVAQAAEDAARAAAAFVPFALSDSLMSPYVMGKNLFQSNQGGVSQFNPAGYTSSYSPIPPALMDSIYGAGGYDPKTGMPNAQGREFQFNKAVATGGVGSAVGGMLSQGVLTQGALGAPPQLDTDRLGILQRGIALLPQGQQIAANQQLVGQLQSAPPSLATAELIKQLNDNITQLTQATDANTSATSAMTDVLSPFYSSDPRSTHLGFRAFAGGGIMTQYGELPLRHYQGGGMATSAQVAVYGEGSTPEAFVPVPSGRIPVELRTPANSNQRPVQVTINVMGNASAGTVAALKATAFQQAQTMRRVIG